MSRLSWLRKKNSGSVYVEQLVLVTLVAVVFATATIALGPALLTYHAGIESVLSLPVP